MREIEIERLLQWAYREELPKRGIGNVANSWEPVIDYGERGFMRIDDEPGFPVILGPPHPDALTIQRAVQGLREEVTVDWSSTRGQLMGDLAMLAVEIDDPFVVAPAGERGHVVSVDRLNEARVDRSWIAPRQRVFSEVALIEQYARMGKRPLWDVGMPAPQRMLGKNNKPLLIGECKDTGRYTEGSYCPLVYTAPTVAQVAFRRAEYSVWRDALVAVTGTLLAWTLNDHSPGKPTAPALPWLDRAFGVDVPAAASTWRNWPAATQRRQPAPAASVPAGG